MSRHSARARRSGRRPTRRNLSLLAAALAALAVAGCGDEGGSKAKGTGTEPPKVVPAGSTEKALERLWRWIRVGSPSAITAYDQDLVREVGKLDMLNGLDALRGQITASKPRIVSVDDTAVGTQVIVRQTPPEKGEPPPDSVYLLRRKGKDWLVVYDGPLTQALASRASEAATTKAQRKANSKAKEPPPAARAAGAAAATTVQEQAFAAIPLPSDENAGDKPAKSPKAALDRLWDWIRIGSPAAITAYDRKLVRKLGAAELLTGLQALRQPIDTSKPRITAVEGTDIATLVVVEQKPPEGPAIESSYLLTKRGNAWIVQYDGILAQRLIGGATQEAIAEAQREIDPNAVEPSQAARLTGATAGEKLRNRLNSLVPASRRQQVAPRP